MLLLTQSFNPEGSQVADTERIVHPSMFHLAVIASTFSCMDAELMIDKIYEFKIEEETRAEMILVVVEETPQCWDANVD